MGDRMRPKQQHKARHDDFFRDRFDQIINMKYELVVLADKLDPTSTPRICKQLI